MSVFVFFQPKVSGLSDIIVSTTQPLGSCVSLSSDLHRSYFVKCVLTCSTFLQQGQGLSLFTNLIQDFKTLALGPEVCKHSILLSVSCLDGLWSLSVGHGVALKDNLWVVPPLPSDTPTHFCVENITSLLENGTEINSIL